MNEYFQEFKEDITKIDLPEKFTFPFYYTPHPLALMATKQLQKELETNNWEHNFGHERNLPLPPVGKMFGILVVQNQRKQIGFLKAYSGKLYQNFTPKGFCPFILDAEQINEIQNNQSMKINSLTQKISELENQTEYKAKKENYMVISTSALNAIEHCKKELTINKEQRRKKRINATKQELEILSNESMRDKFYQKHLTEHFKEKMKRAYIPIKKIEADIQELKNKRKHLSQNLQEEIFKHYQLLNYKKESKNLLELFQRKIPSAGSGDCAAPKLLNQAYKMNLEPVAMAEFWWGAPHPGSTKSHKQFYPACSSKCRPILPFMLQGLSVDIDPINNNDTRHLKIEIIFEDKDIIIINKPSGLLSVPGKILKDSVQNRFKKIYPNLDCSLIVHRLDQDTSGIMILTKSKLANKEIQKQFINRTIKKYYVAILNGVLNSAQGQISLPLRGDPDNRPCQLVCHEFGKKSVTNYKVLEILNGLTRIEFEPITGRTHQLRVHSAHKEGFGIPIKGDDLYGDKANRLHLHAYKVSFDHPVLKKRFDFTSPPNF